jgi:hypothetical protein
MLLLESVEVRGEVFTERLNLKMCEPSIILRNYRVFITTAKNGLYFTSIKTLKKNYT